MVPAAGLLGPDGPVRGAAAVQTPQAFRAPGGCSPRTTEADADGFTATDTAGVLERYADVRGGGGAEQRSPTSR